MTTKYYSGKKSCGKAEWKYQFKEKVTCDFLMLRKNLVKPFRRQSPEAKLPGTALHRGVYAGSLLGHGREEHCGAVRQQIEAVGEDGLQGSC